MDLVLDHYLDCNSAEEVNDVLEVERENHQRGFIVAICCDYCKATRNVFARQIIYWFLRGKRKYFSDDRQTLSGTPHKPPGQEKQEARDDDDDPPAGDGNGRRDRAGCKQTAH